MKEVLLDFILIFLVVYLIYILLINKKRKNYDTLKKNSEVLLIINRYKLNMRKVKYKRLINYIAIIDSFIIAISSTIVINVESTIYGIILAFATIMILTYSLYEFLGKVLYKKCKEDN